MQFKGASFYLVLAIGAVLLLLIGIDVVNRLQTQGDLVPPLAAVVVLLCALAYVIVFRRLQDFGVQTPPRRPGQRDRTRSTRAKTILAATGGLVLVLGFCYVVITHIPNDFQQFLVMAPLLIGVLPVLYLVARRTLREEHAELSPAVKRRIRRIAYVAALAAWASGALINWLFGQTIAFIVFGAVLGGGILVAVTVGEASTEDDKGDRP